MTSHGWVRVGKVWVALVVAGVARLPDARAANRYWRGDLLPAPPGNESYWFDTADWWSNASVPGADDKAWFSGSTNAIPDGSNFTVRLDKNVTNQGIEWVNGDHEMTLDLNGLTYTTTSSEWRASILDGRAAAGEDPAGTTVVTLTSASGAGVANWAFFGIGYHDRGPGILKVDGSNTTLNITENQNAAGATVNFRVGGAGTGTLEVLNGAAVASVAELSVGSNATGNGTLRIGQNSSVTVTDRFIYIGSLGTGALTVESGGLLHGTGATRGIRFSHSSGSSATGLITGNNSRVEADGYVYIGHDTGRTADVAVEKGGRLKSGTQLLLGSDSALRVYGHAVDTTGSEPVVKAAVETDTYMRAYGTSTLAFTLSDPEEESARVATGTYLQIDSDVTLELDLSEDYTFSVGDRFTLIRYATTLTGSFDNCPDTGDLIDAGDGRWFEIDYGTGSNSAITVEAIPEPGAALLILLGLGGLALHRRRR